MGFKKKSFSPAKKVNICRHCGRGEKDHQVPPFEYSAMLSEQVVCPKGFQSW